MQGDHEGHVRQQGQDLIQRQEHVPAAVGREKRKEIYERANLQVRATQGTKWAHLFLGRTAW